MTAKEWKDNNLENTNLELIKMNIKQTNRLIKLNESARFQMNVLINNRSIDSLKQLKIEEEKNKCINV